MRPSTGFLAWIAAWATEMVNTIIAMILLVTFGLAFSIDVHKRTFE